VQSWSWLAAIDLCIESAAGEFWSASLQPPILRERRVADRVRPAAPAGTSAASWGGPAATAKRMAALQIQALVVGALAVHSPALTGMRSQVGRQSPSGSSSGEPRRRVSQEAAAVLPPSQALPDCSLDSFTFSVYSGNATGTVTSSPGVCSTAHLSSSNELPAAAAFSSELFRVDPVAIYEVSWAVQTSADFAAAKGCKLAATAFVQYFDAHDLKFGPTRDSDGWAPALADQTQAPVVWCWLAHCCSL
jgi:hypothetical protein